MENEIKEVVSPKGLKPKNQRKRAPKPMKEEEKKKKKRSRSEDGRRTSVKESWVRIPRGYQRLGIPEVYNTAKTRLKQLKGKHQKTQETKGKYVLLRY